METAKQKLFSPNKAAQVLDVSRGTIYSLMRLGRLKFVYVGADRRIPAEEVDRIASEGAATK